MLSDAELVRLAGKAACERGRGYYWEGHVQAAADALEGEAHGTETHRLWLPPSCFTDA